MANVFLYWDHSNLDHHAQKIAAERDGNEADGRMRLHFRNLLYLASAERSIEHAVVVGSVPPELRHVWTRLEHEGVKVDITELGALYGAEHGAGQKLQSSLLRDALDYSRAPGIVVVLTGDGRGFYDGAGFHADLKRMHRKGWRIEVLSWTHSCDQRVQEWAAHNGRFIALDNFYDSVTFLEPPPAGRPAPLRDAQPIDLTRRLV